MKHKKKKKPFMTLDELKEMALYLVFGFLGVGAFGLMMWALIEWGTPPENKMSYDTSVLSVCVTPELGAEQTQTLTLGSNSKIAVGYVGREDVHEWQVALPDEHIPDDASGVDIVICVDENRQTFDTCNYTGGTTYYIQQLNPRIYVFHQETGIGFDSAAFQGEMPQFNDCPVALGNTNGFSGGLPTKDFVVWVEDNIP